MAESDDAEKSGDATGAAKATAGPGKGRRPRTKRAQVPAAQRTRTGLDIFYGHIIFGTKKLAALPVAGGVVSLPLFAGMAGFVPPWPPGLVILTSLIELVVMVVAYQLLGKAREWLASLVIAFAALAVIAFSGAYLYANATFVYKIPNNDTRVVMAAV